ncbi:MAG: NADH-quinone oxidoreductase subunit N [Chloroflexi bacterium]|nr:NADH-quinone oxidoreductase subunit N [Chloroflexota bacterium]MYE31306.1 NADH-quinone oxidoreductase subunit N [Chloroflexota bacterium]
MSDLNFEYGLLLPEFILVGSAAVVLMLDAFRADLRISRNLLPAITVLGALIAGVASLLYLDRDPTDFAQLIAVDDYTTFFRILFIATLVAIVLGSYEFVNRNITHQGEFYALLLASTIGAIYMAAARELLTAYISIELLSFSLYVGVSLAKNDTRSGEAGLKYVLLGGVASAMLLYGLSIVYGTTGSTTYEGIAAALEDGVVGTPAFLLGLAFLVGGLGFKASAVPFHMWTPDAYEGAPLPITAYISATSKAATFALMLALFGIALDAAKADWQWMIASLAVATMVVGNLIAIQQTNIKRLLAYSSIGQVGFMLMAITTVSDASGSALLLHLAGYLITNLAVFIAVIAFYNRTGSEEIEDFRGLAETQPYLALVITTALFSLSGMPLLAGFVTKFVLFQAAAEEGFLWLATVAVIMSTVSLYYYLKVIRQMYVAEPADGDSRWRLSPIAYLTTGVLFLGIFLVGLWATPIFEAADGASAMLFG